MTTPSQTLKRLAAGLFPDAADAERFIQALLSPLDCPPALIWVVPRPAALPFPVEPPYPWQPDFVDRVSIEFRPGRDPLHQQGAYYCLDVSSVFAATVLTAIPQAPQTVLDLCAAPGGKSVFAWRLFQPRLLVANEVIGKRTAALISNLGRCHIGPAAVTTADASRLAQAGPASVELVLVDAPCSGQSLLARGKPAPGGFHPATINMNANRQRRILGNAVRLVAPGGHLAYFTCTYARKENEGNAAWLMKHHRDLEPVEVPRLAEFRSHLADFPCYRLWPQQNIGAGGFAVLFRNRSAGETGQLDLDEVRTVWRLTSVVGDAVAGFHPPRG